jgi:cytochrome c-type biogenesis protein CcmH
MPGPHEREAKTIESELVAPCCWSQQVSVHNSPAADAIRADIRTRLDAGEAHQQILDAYVAQYGKAILVEPPARGGTLALYVGPPVALVATAVLLVALVRRFSRRASAEPRSLSSDRAGDPRLAAALDDELARLD